MDLLPHILLVLVTLDSMVSAASSQKGGRKKPGGRPDTDDKQSRPYTSATMVIDKLLHKNNYNRQDPPSRDSPTEVRLGIYVNSFYSISEQTMDYSVSMYLRQQWKDPRLKYESMELDEPEVRLGLNILEQIWIPDTFFRNEKRASFHDVTVPNRLLKLNASGYLWYVTKISAALSCPMKLQKYPLDTQTCPMMFESFGYTMDVMYFSWLDSPVDVDLDMQLPQFNLEEKILYDCSQNYTGGAFPCLEIRFVLRRDIGFFLIQVYVPTILVVILSWVSFWLNIDAIPARVSLGLLTVLTMTTASSGANSSLPRVSYVKAIDTWMSMCLIFVFVALLEFAVVNVISRKGAGTINPVRRPPPPVRKLDAESQFDQINIVENGTERAAPAKGDPEGKHKARRIDKLSRKGFPLAFLLFNIVYWIVYTLPPGPGGEPGG